MIIISHWGCFFIKHPHGYRRFSKSESEWYAVNWVEW